MDFDWEMEPRFGLDANHNNIPDLPNTAEYALNLAAGACATPATNCLSLLPKFNVTFTASATVLPGGLPTGAQMVYKWELDGVDFQYHTDTLQSSDKWTTVLAEGAYNVTITGYVASGIQNSAPVAVQASKTVSGQIRVEDILIVSIGDSFSSGEANPERFRGQSTNTNALWADDGSGNANSIVNQRHRRAHRSTVAWPAQAALEIEQADRHTSVTFVSVATTGATVARLLSSELGSEDEPLPPGGMPGQLAELKSIVNGRRVDLLLISIGINDIGFGSIVRAYLFGHENSTVAAQMGATQSYARSVPYNQRQAVIAAAKTGNFSSVLSDPCQGCIGLNGLPSAYASLNAELTRRFPGQIQNVTVVSYPDATGKRSGQSVIWCDKIVDDLITTGASVFSRVFGFAMPDAEIGGLEEESMVTSILNPLNTAVADEAAKQGWLVVRVQDLFADGHGYCAGYPRLSPGAYYFALGNPFPNKVPPSAPDDSWFRTSSQSNVVQGPLASCAPSGFRPVLCVKAASETLGTLHPNELGHQAVKYEVLRSVALPVDILGIGLHDADDQLDEAQTAPPPPLAMIDRPTDVDLYRVDTSTLRLPTGSRPGTVTQAPAFLATVTISPNNVSKLNPRIRLYDTQGMMLTEVVGRHRPTTTLSYPLTSGDRTLIVAISADTNSTYDVFTGEGDTAGTPGAYQLTFAKPVLATTVPRR
jgi:hypothetical protein